MREKEYKFTIVTNMSKKAYNDKMREYIMQQRTANGEKKIDDILDIENSDIIKEATSEYDKMFIDEALFNEMLQKAKENKGAELTKAEINDIKGQCKYQQITVDTFKEKANDEGIGYTVFQYDKVQADAICKELNSNDDIEEFTCELSADNNDMVDIYIFDKDIENYEYTNGCNFKHISATSIEDSASTVTNSNYDKVEFNQLPFEVPVENVKLAQNVFKNKDYTLSYKTNKNGEKIAVFTINKITLAEAKRMYEEEKSINVVDESVKRCKETDLKDKKKCMSIVRENIKSPSAIIDKLKNEANKGNKDARNLLEINSLLVEANGGKELSEKQWREFNPDRLRVDGEYDNSLINELADKIRKENEKSFTDDTKTDNETSNLADNEVAVLEDIDFGDKE